MSSLHQNLPMRRKMIMRKRIATRGLTNFIRNSWLSAAAVIVMSITLFTVFMASVATLVLNDTVDVLKTEKLDLSLYLKNDTPENIYLMLKSDIAKDDNVLSVALTTSEEMAQKALESASGETKQAIDDVGIDLSETMPIGISIKVKNISDLDSLRGVVLDDYYRSYIDEVNYYDQQFYNNENDRTVSTITDWAQKVQLFGLILGGIFLFITILVIFNTIRMAIFARKEEIEMEKLIGAERYYIRGPFLVEAELYGVLAGIITTIGGYVLVSSINPWLESQGMAIDILQKIMFSLPWCILLVIGTIFVGWLIAEISARLAVRKYLRY
ncbi:FtsX-like permease family protein [Candidatus Saccharibacteria bacterium]|jgi:cell division transport system permease protein|nr:FtsX-like permease family protein [Candidatus Saccharibacteria bacterium]